MNIRSKMIQANQMLASEKVWRKSPKERAEMTISCRDADYIKRVPSAGRTKTIGDIEAQVMHNGILVKSAGYQGEWQKYVIQKLRGVHEPQEEKVFYEILKKLPKQSVMIELGSWWAYYSLWFLSEKEASVAYCCEPNPENLALARTNAELNNIKSNRISYIHAAAGDVDHKKVPFATEQKQSIDTEIRSVDGLVEEHDIRSVAILHMDIQGAELSALKGALKSIKRGKIRFVFISTHHYSISSDPLIHQKCQDFIVENGGHIITDHGILESCSGDGLIVASFYSEDRELKIEVSKIKTSESLFREYEYDVDSLWKIHDAFLEEILKNEKRISELQNAIHERDLLIARQQEILGEIGTIKKHIHSSIKKRVRKNNSE